MMSLAVDWVEINRNAAPLVQHDQNAKSSIP